jgi:hypothetical protein
VLLAVGGKQQMPSGTEKIRIPYRVKNLMISPDEHLRVEPAITIKFVGAEPE